MQIFDLHVKKGESHVHIKNLFMKTAMNGVSLLNK